MKSNNIISYALLMSIGCAFTSVQGHAGTMGSTLVCAPGKIYVSVFGGAGASTKVDLSQYGTAFYTEAEGGPLAVNAFGRTNSRTVGLIGGQVGYQWPAISRFTPAVELEGYYLGKRTFTSTDLSNETTRLPAHDFRVTYPTRTGVFLVNAVANLNLSTLPSLHPYVGAGIGAGVLSISNAVATQVAPPEAGVNHYNSNPSDKDAAFAGQLKAGLSFDLSENISIFGEYRWLYLSASSYTFGSTVYPAHVPTSSWLVELGSQKYNMGVIGIRYSV